MNRKGVIHPNPVPSAILVESEREPKGGPLLCQTHGICADDARNSNAKSFPAALLNSVTRF